MRAPPAPTLQNVLVSHPSTPHGTVATPDDLLAAAVLAADESHEISRPRSMLARVTRRWARLSDSLWRRRSSSRRELTTANPSNPLAALRLHSSRSTPSSRQVVSPPVITFEPSQRGPFHASAEDIHSPRQSTDPHSAQSIEENAQRQTEPIDHQSDTESMRRGAEFEPGKSQVVLSRERQLRAKRREEMLALERAADEDMLDELTVSSWKEGAPRRVRQVGAREDDDTLLLLPRIASVSFTSPSNPPASCNDRLATGSSCPTATPSKISEDKPRSVKVRQLPRVSALMPMRSSRAPVVDMASPVSSAGKASRAGSDSGGSDAVSSETRRNGMYSGLQQKLSYDVAFDNDANEDEDDYSTDADSASDGHTDVLVDDSGTEDEDVLEDTNEGSEGFEGWDGGVGGLNKRHLCRLPTGMSKKDVEREMERAVVEIASDGADSENGEESSNSDDAESASNARVSTSRWRESVKLREANATRSRSDAHDGRSSVEAGFVRRASSSMQSGQALVTNAFEDQAASSSGCGSSNSSGDKARFSRTQDIALFEDDYLSFQGFHGGVNDGRSYYTGMSSLLRSKRISSVTDSVSDESDEGAVRGRSESCRRNKGGRSGRSGRLPLLMRKWSAMDEKKGTS